MSHQPDSGTARRLDLDQPGRPPLRGATARATYAAMSRSPLIVLPADVKEIDLYRWHAAAETYCRAIVAGFGGTPLIMPSLEGVDIAEILSRVDGVLVPGSRSNVHPARYGAAPDPRARARIRGAAVHARSGIEEVAGGSLRVIT